MGVPNSQLTANFSAKYQSTTIFLANSQLTTNFGLLLTFTFLQRILYYCLTWGIFPLVGRSLNFGIFQRESFEVFFMGDEHGMGGCTQNGLEKCRFIILCL